MLLLWGAAAAAAAAVELQVIVEYPTKNGDAMELCGDGFGLFWDTGLPMKQHTNSSFIIILKSASNESDSVQIQMKPRLNGNWSIGANFQVRVSSGSHTVVLQPWFGSQPGRYVNIRDVHSPQLSNDRDMVIYLPPSYDENPFISSYDLILAQDGQNLFNDSTAFGGASWRCDRTIDELVIAGKMREVIMVGVDNAGADRIKEYTYSADPKYGDTRSFKRLIHF